MNWDTAPQELGALRAQVTALTEERDKYRKQVVLGFKHLMETPVLTDTAIEEGYTAFEHLRLALVKALAERDWFNHKSKCLEMERVSQEKYIAAAQAQVAALKEDNHKLDILYGEEFNRNNELIGVRAALTKEREKAYSDGYDAGYLDATREGVK
jgi:hypothetical protein